MELKTKFDDTFWKSETRSDYFVSEKEKKIWAVEIDLLNELLRVCDKYNLKVFVFAGTLLGAVRHNGFIPWDDDLDVCLTREDYERLLEVGINEFREPYFLQHALSDKKYFIGYARLRNSKTTGIIKWNYSKEYNNGIYIDIVPMDGYIDNKESLTRLFRKRNRIERLIGIYLNKSDGKFFKKFFRNILRFLLRAFVKYSFLVKKYNKVVTTFNKKTDKVSVLTDSPIFSKYWCYKSDLFESIKIKFENILVPVPKEYDSILTNLYGDYNCLPPKEKRGEWHKGKIYFDPETPYLVSMDKEIDFDGTD